MRKWQAAFMLPVMLFLAFPLFAAPVPDTGQTKCYDIAGNEITCPQEGQPLYGQDANYSINPPSYTKLDINGNALVDSAADWNMVRDNVTGLIWEVKTNKDGVKNYDDPHDADNTYTWYDSNPATNGGYAGTSGDGTDTEDFIKALNDTMYGGYSDWRLPNISELAYISDSSLPPPNVKINLQFFPNTQQWYWSSISYYEQNIHAWYWMFDIGQDSFGHKYHGGYVRAVRGNQIKPAFFDNGDRTVTDISSGLMWEKETPEQSMLWKDALSYCENLILSKYNDWRIPTIKELRSIVDYSRYNQTIDTSFFPNTKNDWYWSSTSCTHRPDLAWDLHFDYGYDGDAYKTSFGYVRAVRGGRGGSIGNLSISPFSVSFPSLYIGETSSSLLTVSNQSQAPVTIDDVTITGDNSSDFSLEDSCLGADLPAKDTCNIVVNFSPRSCGNKSAIVTVSTNLGDLTAYLYGNACGSGSASLTGIVRDAKTAQAVVDAAVMVGSNGPYMTDASGAYLADDLPPGTYEIIVSKQGYDPWIGSITLNPQQASRKDMLLTQAATTGFRVTSLTSQYSKGSRYYVLPGVSFDVTFTARVNWAGKTPDKVRFITSNGSHDVAVTGDTASIKVDIGSECAPCSTLQAVAIAADGTQSDPKDADFIVTDPLPVDPEIPIFTNNLSVVYAGSDFSYRNNSTLSKNILDQTIGDFGDDIPILGGYATAFKYSPELDFEFSGNEGKASYTLSIFQNADYQDTYSQTYTRRKNEHGLKNLFNSVNHLIAEGKVDRRHFPTTKIAGFEFHLFPVLEGYYSFNPATCGTMQSGWGTWSANVGAAGEAELEAFYQSVFVAPLPLPPIPYYGAVGLGIGFDFLVNLVDPQNLTPDGMLSTRPYLFGTFGVGVHDVVGLEGTGKGGVDIAWEFPVSEGENAITDCDSYFEITGKAYVLRFELQFPTKRWDVSDCSSKTSSSMSGGNVQLGAPQAATGFTLIPSNYLSAANPTAFHAKPVYKQTRFTTQGQSYTVDSSPVVTSTFPVSTAQLSSSGSHMNLFRLEDNQQRPAAINRTMVIHSAFDGESWSTPNPVADNGTADFNPISLTFGDGVIVCAWEDIGSVLEDNATLEDMTAQMEVSAAVYDPATQTWGQAIRLTNNPAMDRTPKLAGPDKSHLMLTWISNGQNDLFGSAAHPNQINYAIYDGINWSTPQVAAVIPNQIKRYNVVYDGLTANVVLALDTDDDPSTLEDMELYHLVYNNDEWGALTRLTSDSTIDDNPQLALDVSQNVVMTWLKGKELSRVVNFDFTSRSVIWASESYSSSLADFRQATTADGRVALIYSGISDGNSCDLYGVFYDPIFKMWGRPKQLSNDPETEQWPSITFRGSDTIISIFNRKLLLNTDKTLTTAALSDIYLLKHTLMDDLALEEGSLTINIPNAAPGTAVVLSVKVQNLGDNTAQNFTVSFYNGDPANGGTLIGSVVVTEPLIPGDSITVSLPWTIPDGDSPVSVYAVIDPDATIDPVNRSNNVVSTTVSLPDLNIQSFTWEKLTTGHYNLHVAVANIGGTTSGATTVTLRMDSDSGTLVTTLDVPSLARYASIDLACEWKPAPPIQSSYTLVALADEGNGVNETDEMNNRSEITVIGETVIRGDINGDRNLDLTDAVLCLQVLVGMLPENLQSDVDVDGDGKIGMAEVIYILQNITN